MHKLYIWGLSLACLAFGTRKVAAQAYELKVLSGQAYKEIDSADYEVPDSSVYFSNIRTNPKVNFGSFGKPYDLSQAGMFIPILEGYCYYSNQTHSTTLYISKGDYAERPGANEISMFSFKKEATSTGAVFVMQWKNMGLPAGDAGDFMNFQIKLFEATGVIEYCFGPSAVKSGMWENGANGPTIGLLEMDDAFNTIYNQIWLSGSSSTPNMVSTNGIVNLSDVPQAGMVYRFTPKPTNINAVNKRSLLIPTVYKAGASIRVDCSDNSLFILTDMTGRKVSEMRVKQGIVELADIPQGNYVLRNMTDGKAARILVTE